MYCKVFKFSSTALNATAFDEAEERLNQWITTEDIDVAHIAQSSHIRHDTDGSELVDIIYTILCAE